jgi:hypothetical protein
LPQCQRVPCGPARRRRRRPTRRSPQSRPHREAWEAAGEASSLADRATGRAARTAESAKRRADRAEAKAFQRLIERAHQTRAGARAALAYLVERMRTSLGLAFGAEATAALARSRALED